MCFASLYTENLVQGVDECVYFSALAELKFPEP